MNQGRIWCVVHPTVGLPLMLGSVALTALAVHASIMTHTTWFSNYWQGAKARVASTATATPTAAAQTANGFAMTVTPVPTNGAAAPASFVITVTPSPAAAVKTLPVSDTPAAHRPSASPIHTASVN